MPALRTAAYRLGRSCARAPLRKALQLAGLRPAAAGTPERAANRPGRTRLSTAPPGLVWPGQTTLNRKASHHLQKPAYIS